MSISYGKLTGSVFALFTLNAVAENIAYPVGTGIINVTAFSVKENKTKVTYGADPTGLRDSSDAIIKAIDEGVRVNTIVYFPNGIYRVSKTMIFSHTKIGYGNALDNQNMRLQGQSRAGAIIKLADGTFTDAANPRPMISYVKSVNPADGFNDPTKGGGNIGFNNTLRNLTIDIGANNPGASAVRFHGNNNASLRDVTIRSSDPARCGAIGLDLSADGNGPLIVKNVSISGFDIGMKTSVRGEDHAVEHLELSGQRTLGILNLATPLSIRNLVSTNNVPALRNEPIVYHHNKASGAGQIVLVDSVLKGGDTKRAAIENPNGWLFARKTKVTGYATAVQNRGVEDSFTHDGEFCSDTPVRAFPTTPTASLDLPVQETPEIPWDDPATWLSVKSSFNGVPGALGDGNHDDGAAIQSAIDAAGPANRTLYLPAKGIYTTTRSLVLRGHVRRLLLLSPLLPKGNLLSGGQPVFRITDGPAPTVWIELSPHWPSYDPGNCYWFSHETKRTLVLLDSLFGRFRCYRNTIPGGKVFIENLGCGGRQSTNPENTEPTLLFKNQAVWARQLNPERRELARNEGSLLWVLGFKTEGPRTAFATYDGGATELLGGTLFTNSGGKSDGGQAPAFVNVDSHVSIIAFEARGGNDRFSHAEVVQETRAGKTITLGPDSFPQKSRGGLGSGSVLPLYNGYDPATLKLSRWNLSTTDLGH